MKPCPQVVQPPLDTLQRETFDYFLHEANEENGLILDKTATNWPASIAAVGLALTSYPIGVERGYLSRDDAVDRTHTTLRFFATSAQGTEPNATGHRGFFYHFLDLQSGRRAWKCELSTVDTALFLAGALVAGQYFDWETEAEADIRALADQLYRRADPSFAAGELRCLGRQLLLSENLRLRVPLRGAFVQPPNVAPVARLSRHPGPIHARSGDRLL